MTSKKRVIFARSSPPVSPEKGRAAKMGELAKNPGIPVLTDILHTPERKRPPTPVKSAVPATASPGRVSWDELEERLTARIQQQIMARLDFVLDDNVLQHVSTVLEKMAGMLTEEIRYDMQNTLEVIITHAISSELQQLRKNDRKLENSKIPPET